MIVKYTDLIHSVKGLGVPKPLSGTLSGHAAGEPFDKRVYTEIKNKFPKNTFRQYEYLNKLYIENQNVISYKDRKELFESSVIHFLLTRGKDATKKWRTDNLFEEKQNDTADILVVKDGLYEIIDIKTRNISKKAQPPNIISAFKLAQMCSIMIDDKKFNEFTINYFQVDWKLVKDELVCTDAYNACLFKTNPKNLYINWAAAMQIQFHVSELDQSFPGTMEDWAHTYLEHFVSHVYKRSEYMVNKFAKPFENKGLT
jgi:type II restriction enzyme